ncbi:hypothetical protein SLS55_001893 [Diplodia seriata]|uniref:Uncharacterized protein n=1 Tax=Diplodia seriata TaxID=420778 RepID=A0A0G2E0L9_9PEZI|nr:hypothetical protein UCDDS831_g06875 [Diplodia seriata]
MSPDSSSTLDHGVDHKHGTTTKGGKTTSKWRNLESWFGKVLKWPRHGKDVMEEDLRRTLILMIPEVRIDPRTGQSYESDTQRQARARFDKCWEGDDDAVFIHPSLLDDLELPVGYYQQYEPDDPRSQWENADGTTTNVIGEVTRTMRWCGETNVRRIHQEIFVPDSIAIRSKAFVLSPSSHLEVLVPLEVIRKNRLDRRPRRLALAGGKRRPDPDVSDGNIFDRPLR